MHWLAQSSSLCRIHENWYKDRRFFIITNSNKQNGKGKYTYHALRDSNEGVMERWQSSQLSNASHVHYS